MALESLFAAIYETNQLKQRYYETAMTSPSDIPVHAGSRDEKAHGNTCLMGACGC